MPKRHRWRLAIESSTPPFNQAQVCFFFVCPKSLNVTQDLRKVGFPLVEVPRFDPKT